MTPSSAAASRPTVDEWGVYDPQQAGLAALYTRLTTNPGPRPEPPDPATSRGERAPAAKTTGR